MSTFARRGALIAAIDQANTGLPVAAWAVNCGPILNVPALWRQRVWRSPGPRPIFMVRVRAAMI
jgi:hypothetical protein